MRTVLGVDAGSETPAEAEHLLLDLADRLGAGPGAVLCTHPVRDAAPHYAISLDLPGAPAAVLAAATALVTPTSGLAAVPAAIPAAADSALAGTGPGAGPVRGGSGERQGAAGEVAAAHAAGTSGRAVRFPGADRLTGTVPVAAVLAGTAIDGITVLGGGTADGCVLHTRDFVRPEWRDGRLVLLVLPAGDGRVAPFEVPNPTPCCATHG